MKTHQRTQGLNDEWLTPPEIIKALGEFDLDPCDPAFGHFTTASSGYCEADDGLSKPWFGRVWLNPPFNRYSRPKWMAKMSAHGNGIMLIPAATETQAFYEYVWNRASAVLFVKGRPHFHYIDGTRAKANCGTAIALVGYGYNNRYALEQSGLGKVVVP